MADLAEAVLDLIRPQLEAMIDERAEQIRFEIGRPWMTTEEAAEYLRLSPAAVRQRAQRGTIPAHKDDADRWLFHREELDSALGLPKRSC